LSRLGEGRPRRTWTRWRPPSRSPKRWTTTSPMAPIPTHPHGLDGAWKRVSGKSNPPLRSRTHTYSYTGNKKLSAWCDARKWQSGESAHFSRTITIVYGTMAMRWPYEKLDLNTPAQQVDSFSPPLQGKMAPQAKLAPISFSRPEQAIMIPLGGMIS